VGVDLIGLGLTAVDGFHVEGVSEDKGDALLLAEVGKPVPGEHTLTGDGESVTKGSDGLEEGIGIGSDGLLPDDGSLVIENAEGQGSGVEIDPTVESVLLVVESHRGLPVKSYLSLVTSSMLNAKRP
jgi:hypothetical protein